MKWLLVLLFPLLGLGQSPPSPLERAGVRLKPGTYRDLKLEKPIVLKNGSYTFVGLEMKPPKSSEGGLWPGIWMDASKADTVRFTDCRFTEIENGVALKLNGAVYMNNCKLVGRTPNKASTGIDFAGGKRLQIQNSTFSNLNTALRFNAGGATDRHLHLTRNKFTNNLTSIELNSGLIDFQLRCNEFTTPNPTPTGQTRYGLRIGEGGST